MAQVLGSCTPVEPAIVSGPDPAVGATGRVNQRRELSCLAFQTNVFFFPLLTKTYICSKQGSKALNQI